MQINFLFLFLPRKDYIKDVIRMAGSQDLQCLCVTGWGHWSAVRIWLTHHNSILHNIYGLDYFRLFVFIFCRDVKGNRKFESVVSTTFTYTPYVSKYKSF